MSRKAILLERLQTYCNQLGVGDCVPKIIWTKKEMKELPATIRGSRLGRFTYGFCPTRANFLFICYSRHANLRALDDTLRHELIHYRFPQIKHSKKFDTMVKNLKSPSFMCPMWDRNDYVKGQVQILMKWAFRNFIHYSN